MKKNPDKRNPNRSDFPHGTYTGYQYGCRQEDCLEAKREYERGAVKRLGTSHSRRSKPLDRVWNPETRRYNRKTN